MALDPPLARISWGTSISTTPTPMEPENFEKFSSPLFYIVY